MADATEAFPQLAITRIAPNHMYWIRLKQVLQREPTLIGFKVCGRFRGNPEKGIFGRSRNIVLDLPNQGRDQVERLMNPGELIEEFDHPVVVLQSVKPDPRQAILAGDQVFVKGLMLMPQKDNAQSRHEKLSLARGRLSDL
jgi:hypothetical protein